MKIDRQDLYHGAALLQIIEDGRGPVISRMWPEPYYRVLVGIDGEKEDNRYLYIKYISRNLEPFRFSFTKHERKFLEDEFLERSGPVFIVLVCGTSYVCVLDAEQYSRLGRDPNRLVLQVETPERGRIRVKRWGERMRPLLVAHSAFPKNVLC
ncbi:hypothetical protein H7K24_18760 [Mycobacterium fragae]|uniref:hypothetical protein n=1 Tax=Mycobacterium fragae TaxID=1260918 RepID=UPI00111BF246|nr:hypothetical protein [Mycobacterium fragae]MCV7402181.1 hypothetical protein [Mycobacterium fragae]